MLTKRPKAPIRGAVDKKHEWQQKQGIKKLLWLLLGVALCIVLGVFLSLSPSLHKKTTTNSKDETPPPLAMEYEFYERLPKQRFVGALDTVAPMPSSTFVVDDYKPLPTTIPEHYTLQIQSYDNADAAEQKRGQVMMAGVEATVAKRVQDDGKVVYRVMSPPLDEQAAHGAYDRLKASGIDSVVIYNRHSD